MRALTSILLLSVLASACRHSDEDRPTKLTPTQIPASFRAPKAALQLADTYIAALPGKQAADRESLRQDFCQWFLQGFTMPGATMGGGTDASQRGFVAGQDYCRANPAKAKETMEGFGYTAFEVTGVWTEWRLDKA
jgi:hypothetical protein